MKVASNCVGVGVGGVGNCTIVCSRPEDGLRCRLGVKPPLKLKLGGGVGWRVAVRVFAILAFSRPF